MQTRIHTVLLLVVVLALGAVGPLQAQEETLPVACDRQFPFANGGIPTFNIRALDVWADGDLAAVAAGELVHLVDFSSPDITLCRTFELDNGDFTWDVKLKDNILYVGLQASRADDGVLIYDVSNTAAPRLLSRVPGSAHNLFVAGNTLFVVDGDAVLGCGDVKLVDVTDPSNPIDLGLLDPQARTNFCAHDLTVIGSRVYIAGWGTGIWILDVANLDTPSALTFSRVLSNQLYDQFLGNDNNLVTRTHNVWPSADGTLLWTTDEVRGEGIRVFDISNPRRIELLDFFQSPRTALDACEIPHNVVVDGEFAYVSYYQCGLRVLQFVDGEVVEVAARDTVGTHDRRVATFGAFGVFPMGDRVLVSDTFNGLLVFDKADLVGVEEDAP